MRTGRCPKSEAWPWPIRCDDFHFALAAGDFRSASDFAVPARLFRTNLDKTPGLQFAGKSPGIFA